MFKNYLMIAYKVYTRRKLFTAISLFCITLTLVVLLVVTALLQNAFHPSGVEGKSDRFLQVMTIESISKDGEGRNTSPLGYKVIAKYLKPMKSAETVAAVTQPDTVSIYQDDRVTKLLMRRADAEYWQILDFEVLAGRVPTKDDVSLGRFVAVLNESSAKKLFPGSSAMGQSINVGGQQFEIIGIVEDTMHLNAYADIWAPITTYPSSEYRDQISGEFTALLLAKTPADLALIKAEVKEIATHIELDDPKIWSHSYIWADSKLDYFARELLGNHSVPESGAGTMIAILWVLALLFMLLPALNLVNLNTGRIMERSVEIGVRKAFGASSDKLVVQFIVENILLCLAGGLLGLIGAKAVLLWLEGSGLIPYLKVDINLSVFFYSLIISLLFGVLSGVIPAWKMSRLNPVQALKGAA